VAADIAAGKITVDKNGWIAYPTKHFVVHYTKKSAGDYMWFADNAEKVWDTESKWFESTNWFGGKKLDIWVKE
jgi:hypothetical protein